MAEESTTPDLLELTRQLFEALNKGDFGGLVSSLGPVPVLDVSAWGFGTYEGTRAIRRFLDDWFGSFDEYEREALELLDLGNGVIFAAAVTRGTPKGRRAPVELSGASVFLWKDGRIVRITNYRDLDEARAAASRLAAAGVQASSG